MAANHRPAAGAIYLIVNFTVTRLIWLAERWIAPDLKLADGAAPVH
ncbi:MAG: hypothetical protein ACT4N4_06330 [Rhodospirillales bacterium]